MSSHRPVRKGIKYTRKYLITVTAGMILLAAVSALLLKIYSNVMIDSIKNKGGIATTDYYLAVCQILSREIDSVNVACEKVNRMLDENASPDQVEAYLTTQTDIYLNILDGNYEGLYMYYEGTYLDGLYYDMVGSDFDSKERPWYSSAVEADGEIAISEPYEDSVTGETIITISKLCKDKESVVAADVDLKAIQKITVGVTENSSYTFAAVVEENGFINSCSNEGFIGQTLADYDATIWDYFTKNIQENDNKSYCFVAGKGRNRAMLFARQIYGDWYVVLSAKRDLLYHSIYLMHIISLVVYFIVAAYMLFFFHNVRKTRASRNEFRKLSEMDQMTKIFNRGYGEFCVRETIKDKALGAFFLMDADHFKSINDTYGHSTGDKVLIAFAKVLRNSFRTKDIVFRLGGDEFACFAPGMTDEEEISRACERLIENVSAIEIPELEGRKICISIGIAVTMENEDFDKLYHRADSAAYISKKTEGSCFTFAERSDR